ncbi:MAG: PD-(D/E)XK nuclease family protein [Burkholderiaceae bacterium]|nr:PD-(D/E)XK nuclease family protein [Burkholderiaceae bacterium]
MTQPMVSVAHAAALRDALRAGATVITPNRRLARALKSAFDRAQLAAVEAGAAPTVWPAADVLPWSAWLMRCAEDVRLRQPQPDRIDPDVLAPLQQQTLWERVIADSAALPMLRHPDAIAQTAAEAWRLLHEQGAFGALLGAAADPHNEDQQAFRGWAREFARRCRTLNAITPDELPAWLVSALDGGRWQPPAPCVLAGFDRIAPVQQRVIDALRAAGTTVDVMTLADPAAIAAPRRLACADGRAQWRAAAEWARARLQADPQARIGIVVPDLGAQREAIVVALTDALAPALRLAPKASAARPFNLSLGRPLAETPLVTTALALLDLVAGALDIARTGALLRSPYLAGGDAHEAEWSRRARLDRRLRDDGHWQLTLPSLRRAAGRLDAEGAPHADAAPRLAQALDAIDARLTSLRGRRATLPRLLPSAWAAQLFDLLHAAGFPGARALDSVEFQTLTRWRELMASLGTLDAIVGTVTLADIVARLRRAAADTLFQPESDDVPVQVLGVLESAGLQFDHLWIANATDDRWPPEAQPNPLLPLAWQRAWQLPSASAERALLRAQAQMAGWAAATHELVYSHPQVEGDRPLAPSPLIAALPEADAPSPPSPIALRLQRGLPMQTIDDAAAPPLVNDGLQRGGVGVFTDQSACAFRGFAVHRLHAVPIDTPQPGLDALVRGSLLHQTLQSFWQGLDSQRALRALDAPRLHARVGAAADDALDRLARAQPDLLGPRLRELERERLLRAVHAWLDVEDLRPPFQVVTVEADREAVIGGLRIAVRPDRVDRLDDGALVVIDYKTGQCRAASWLDERPDAPQLPLYATAFARDGERVGAIAFAQLRPGETHAVALSAVDAVFPAARRVDAADILIAQPGWDGLMADWAHLLERLAAEFTSGAAAVAPKSPASCRHCALPLVCRIGERRSLAARLAQADQPEANDE